ncbi:MAG: nucleotidyltransferase domain-containing protein [Chloroflexota bacterium]|nr:nucleotidyltransferase domain-containing protein [Chloroflexota bacterium]MDE2962228.1 nucleotidyltransferase domain-containing protein [Chloroflexota bacterium]
MSLSPETAKAVLSQPDADLASIRQMADAVGSALQARCVILYGSRARGDHRHDSDVDLAIVADEVELTAQERADLRERARAIALSAAVEPANYVDVIVWTEAEYRTKKRSINHVAGRAWREGLILYGAHETLPGEEIVSELDNARELMRMCQGQTRALLGMVFDDETFSENIFGFHAQRGAELAFKAWITLLGQRYERTHNVADLLAILADNGVGEAQPFAHLATLTPYAVKYVYEEIENPTMDRHYVANEVNALAELVASLLQQAETEDVVGG